MQRILAACGAVGLALCLLGTSLLGWEDHLVRAGGRQQLETAARLAPGDARTWAALAALGGPDRHKALETASAANPYDSKAWIDLGLDAELAGDRARAERLLLEAARVDRTYQPRWSLANFYFRSGDTRQFWQWLREAARMSYGDPRPLAELAWNLAEDAPEGLAALGDRAPVLDSYASLLLDNNRLSAAETAATGLVALAGKDAAVSGLLYCDRFLDAGRPDAALRLWNRMAGVCAIPARRLDPERGPHLTNGDFSAEPLGRGFDWRLQAVNGIETIRFGASEGIRFAFSGNQPQDCMLMLERVALAPERPWRLVFEYRSEGMPTDTGLRWRTTGAEWRAAANEDWKEAAFEFNSAPGGPVAPLVLAYRRAPGTVRSTGSFWLRHVRLEAAAPETEKRMGWCPPARP